MADELTMDTRQFDEIAPYSDDIFHEKMAGLIKEPGFEHAVKWVLPEIDFNDFCNGLLEVKDKTTFQRKIMWPFLEMLASKTTSGITISGLDKIDKTKAYTFITNHRDIVLDTSFLNLCFLRAGYPTTEVAIGDNLLIYAWINDLVRLNKSFIVKRDLPRVKALEAAQQLSAYIHYAITGKNQSVWIAERQGRSKDSSDMAQDSLIKMLGLAGDKDFIGNLEEVNLLPVSISYEYDPNDYLKAREFLLRRNDPDFKKTQRDDLFSMETGLLSQKGRVHFHLGKCINDELAANPAEDRTEVVHTACGAIDRAIHCGYRIFPCNYIAFDEVNGTDRYSDCYTEADVKSFDEYIERQLAKVEVEDINDDERTFMRRTMLSMYANPLKNQIEASPCR